MPKLILGLGNPGQRYVATRHNFGLRVVQALATRGGMTWRSGRCHADEASGALSGTSVILATSHDFMNESGRAAAALVNYYRVAAPDLLVVLDDLDQQFGHLRFRAAGGAGGHNGLRSILLHLKRDDVARLRIGIGRPPPPIAAEQFVLQPFARDEVDIVPRVVAAAADAVEAWLTLGTERAGTRYNGWHPGASTG